MKVTLFFLLSIFIIILASCTKDADPLPSVTHPEGWMDKQAENFHGKKDQAIGTGYCKPCHGIDYSGGQSGVACYDCHANYPHPPTWTTPGSDSSHTAYIKDKYWSMDECKICHGVNYRGGTSGVSCYTCHPQSGGPEACNTCHGTAAAPVAEIANWAPPKDLDNNLYPPAPGVGAHQPHMRDTTWTKAYPQDCNLCHSPVTDFDDPTHIDGSVDMDFAPIATWDGKVEPVYNFDNYQCSNVYCHGNFLFRKDDSENQYVYTDSVIVGNNPIMFWTAVDGTQAACGTCHDLPPKGHMATSACSACHSSVVDENYNIINKKLHINGEINLN